MKKERIETITTRIISTTFIVVALAVFKPFGLDAWQWQGCVHLIALGVIGFSICMMTDIILKYIVRMPRSFKKGAEYIIRRNLWFQLINTPLVALGICLYRHFVLSDRMEGNQFSVVNFLETLAIIAFCSFAIGLYWRFKYRSKYLAMELEEIRELNEKLKSLTSDPSPESLTPGPSRKERGVDSSAVDKATKLLEECLVYPPHLGEGKLYGAQDNDFLYFLGRYEEGTVGPTEPAAAMYYNDAKPDKIFYAGLCYRKLGQEDKARSLFHKLVNYGKQHIFDHVTMDYFAVSLPDLLIWEDSLDTKNLIHCKYMLALGYLGLGDTEKALRYLSEVEALDINHQGIQQLRTLIDSGLL